MFLRLQVNGNTVVAMLITVWIAGSAASAQSADSAALLARVQSPESSLQEKAIAFEELAILGDAASIEPLAKLIDDPRLSHYARYALQANPDPAAGDALREALGEVHGEILVGVINSVASRGDRQAVGQLAELLDSEDEGVAVAAADALATIGSEAALNALEDTPQAKTIFFGDALLQAALVFEEKGKVDNAAALLNRVLDANPPVHIKQAARLALLRIVPPQDARAMLKELLASPDDWEFAVGLQASVKAGTASYAKELSEALATSPPDRQARLLSALESKTGDDSLEAVRAASESQDVQVRIAVASVLGARGDRTDGPLLVRLALNDPEARDAAIDALVRIEDQGLNERLIGMLKSDDASEQVLAAKVLGLRQATSASQQLYDTARRSNSPAVRLAALGALRRCAPGSSLGQVLDLVKDAKSSDEEQLARQASVEVALRSADTGAAIASVAQRRESWPADKQGVLFDVLARIGGSESLRLVAEAAASPDREIQDDATRVLGAWPTADAAPILLRLASSEHPYAVRSLRGYLRIARQYNSGAERLDMCRRALEVASRDEERQLTLQILALSPSTESLRLAASQLSADALGPEAGEVVITIAEEVASTSPDAAAEAARAVISAGGSEPIIARAEKIVNP